VILDNLSVQKRTDIRSLFEPARCSLVFLTAHSPDFAPIEPAFSKLKGCLRRLGARTQETLDAAIPSTPNHHGH
jgi:transposase